jgi:Flp pilus assembly pilin Flp
MKMIKNEQGQGLTEYIVLMMLICVVSIGVVSTLGKTVRRKISEAEAKINSVSSDPNQTYDDNSKSK